jgi:LacI family transcriptional regulator
LVTIYDVAKRANVSAMTVSRVINNSTLIKETTKRKVLEAIRELDYIPNRSARSLSSKDTKLLSLIITDITNPFFTGIARGAEDRANELGYQVVFSNTDENVDKETDYVRAAVSRGMDGVLLAPAADRSLESIRLLDKYRIPFVLIDREVPAVAADSVVGDNAGAVRLLFEHLFGHGHRRIALLSGPEQVWNTRVREKEYRKRMNEQSLPVDPRWIFRSGLTHRNTAEAARILRNLPEAERPTAVLATNNFLALSLIQSLKAQGMNVPGDISIVCFDDPSPIPDDTAFLTVVAQPAYDFGYNGVQMLLQRIDEPERAPSHLVLPAKLLTRRSVRSLI